jgi:hypothetical protein
MEAEDQGLELRRSDRLERVPVAQPRPATRPPPARESAAPMSAHAQSLPDRGPLPVPAGAGSQHSLTAIAAAGVAVVASVGWLIERRRRLALETEKDSVMWADVQPRASSVVNTHQALDDILPDSPDPAEAARAVYLNGVGIETNSRREATLIDLHQLDGKLRRRRDRGDTVAAVLLLQQHLVDFRYTSPWVFLELRELYRQLDRQNDWDIARVAFRHRFGQNAPLWTAPVSEIGLLEDAPLCEGLVRKWPLRESRMYILQWMLGEHEMRQKAQGPPLLALGIYRDLMVLDTLLDEVMQAKARPADSLL